MLETTKLTEYSRRVKSDDIWPELARDIGLMAQLDASDFARSERGSILLNLLFDVLENREKNSFNLCNLQSVADNLKAILVCDEVPQSMKMMYASSIISWVVQAVQCYDLTRFNAFGASSNDDKLASASLPIFQVKIKIGAMSVAVKIPKHAMSQASCNQGL